MTEPSWSTPPGTIIDGKDATPPAANVKCIIFTLLLACGYWYLPQKNKWVLLGLLYVPYLVMAWYDHHYDCRKRRFGPTFLMHFYDWAKPQSSYQVETYKNWHPKWLRLVATIDLVVALVALMILPSFLKWNPKQ